MYNVRKILFPAKYVKKVSLRKHLPRINIIIVPIIFQDKSINNAFQKTLIKKPTRIEYKSEGIPRIF